MIPAEVKLALYRIALYCIDFRCKINFSCADCSLFHFAAMFLALSRGNGNICWIS